MMENECEGRTKYLRISICCQGGGNQPTENCKEVAPRSQLATANPPSQGNPGSSPMMSLDLSTVLENQKELQVVGDFALLHLDNIIKVTCCCYCCYCPFSSKSPVVIVIVIISSAQMRRKLMASKEKTLLHRILKRNLVIHHFKSP